jgi:ribulose-bisphosphate carboxylase large chain
MGGFDFVKTMRTSRPHHSTGSKTGKIHDKAPDKAEKKTGEKKSAFLNISADVETSEEARRPPCEYGWNYAMIDVVVAGNASVMTMRDYCSDLGLAIHAHVRCMQPLTETRSTASRCTSSQSSCALSVSRRSTGDCGGNLTGTKTESILLADMLRNKKIKEVPHQCLIRTGEDQECVPGLFGGLHPGLVPDVLDIYGKDLVLLVSGGFTVIRKVPGRGRWRPCTAIEGWQEA